LIMKIKNFDDFFEKDDDKHPYKSSHPLYPKVSRTLICGPSGCGKTNLLMQIILGDSSIGKPPMIYFEEIIVYTKTPDQDKFVGLKKYLDGIAKKNKLTSFIKITNESVVDPETLDSEKFRLVIFDDMVLEKDEMNMIKKYFILGRHKRCSCIFLSQSYYDTIKPIRINCSHYHLFNMPGIREKQQVSHDLQYITPDIFEKNTKGYDFITMDRDRRLLYKNADEPLDGVSSDPTNKSKS
jgi:hypothetical protein